MTFNDVPLNAYFFLGACHGGPLLKKVDALGYSSQNTLVVSTSSFIYVDASSSVTLMIEGQ